VSTSSYGRASCPSVLAGYVAVANRLLKGAGLQQFTLRHQTDCPLIVSADKQADDYPLVRMLVEAIDGDLRWHDLRHECGSRLGDRGMGVRRQELIGHAQLTTTLRYMNTNMAAVGAAMKKAMGW
jgi:hypothetical protein